MRDFSALKTKIMTYGANTRFNMLFDARAIIIAPQTLVSTISIWPPMMVVLHDRPHKESNFYVKTSLAFLGLLCFLFPKWKKVIEEWWRM
jgi:hypothetical protein